MAKPMAKVFEYIDYRKLLKDLYEENKKKHPYFSLRYIAQKVGFKSAGFFTNIIQGKRNISAEYIFKFAELFKFKKKETEYFELLVNFAQAKHHSQKRYYFERILSYKNSKVAITDAQHYEFYSKWYYTAVRELIDLCPVTDDYEKLASMVSPSIKPSEAKNAIELLVRMGFIKKDKSGVYQQTERFISTGYDAQSVALTNFVLDTADLAKMAVDRFPRNRRSLSTLTVGVSPECYHTIEERLKDFRREILEIVRADTNPKTVYHVNFHIFPMSKDQ